MRGHDILFYDGHCGLCHRGVLFALKRDPDGSRFRFAPLQGETFARTVPADTRRTLPDSIVVLTPDDRILTRWRAVHRLLTRLGRPWPALARAAQLLPPPLLNLAYDAIAAIRHRLFKRPDDTCPICDESIRPRFLP